MTTASRLLMHTLIFHGDIVLLLYVDVVARPISSLRPVVRAAVVVAIALVCHFQFSIGLTTLKREQM